MFRAFGVGSFLRATSHEDRIMRYQDLRRPRGAGEFWLRVRLWLARPVSWRAPVGRIESLSDHQLRDLGLDPRSTDGDQVSFWRLVR
jgi:hypothetical protein